MTYGKSADGSNMLTLSAEETKKLTEGYPVIKQSGDSQGEFTITVKLTRKNKRRPYPKESK